MKKTMAMILSACLMFVLVGCGQEQTAEPTRQTLETTEAPQVQAPEGAIAMAVTGEQTRYVFSAKELAEAVDPSGNTVITLLEDVSSNKTIALPYSCTIDFGGHAITTNPEQGIGLKVEHAGAENPVTVLKNGKICSFADSLRVEQGAVELSGMELYTAYGNCLALYDPSDLYLSANRIVDSLLYSGSFGCLSYTPSDVDFSKTGIAVENTVMIAANPEGAEVFQKAGGSTKAGNVMLGQNVSLYSYGSRLAVNGMPFAGADLVMTEGQEVNAGEYTCSEIRKWSQDTENVVLDVLMIGNSFSYSFTEELRDMAAAQGIQLNLTNLYYGGRSIKAHWERLQDNQGDYEYWITNAFGRFQHPTVNTLKGALDYGNWDVITMQQHFNVERTVDYETALASCSPYGEDLHKYLQENYPDADLYWQQTWAYQVGYPTNDNGMMPVDSTAVQTRQHTQIRDVSIALCEKTGMGRIPTGDAWQIARGILGDTLCKADCCHDGETGGGQYLNACVWLEVLTHTSCIGNSFRPADYVLDEEKVAVLQQAAHDAVAAVYGPDYAK